MWDSRWLWRAEAGAVSLVWLRAREGLRLWEPAAVAAVPSLPSGERWVAAGRRGVRGVLVAFFTSAAGFQPLGSQGLAVCREGSRDQVQDVWIYGFAANLS